MAAPALLVPVVLEALVVCQKSTGHAVWAWTPPEYGWLSQFLTPDPIPFKKLPPHVPGDRAGFTGVVLHWALPDGITQGIAGPTGAIEYPWVPDRWLVVRKHRDPRDPRTWAFASWVLASDYVGSEQGSPFPNAPGDGEIRIGRHWPLDQWPGDDAIRDHCLPTRLTAVGPGDATYAAFAPNVSNVLSFADPLAGTVRGPLTYSVVGWYSDPDRDVLAGTELFGRDGWLRPEQWRDLMVTRRWSTGGDAGLQAARDAGERWAAAHGLQVDPMLPRSIYPARSLCHGIVTDVAWLGADGPVLSGVPTANTAQTRYVRPMVAIGNSAIDALAALMVHEIGDEIDAEHRRSLFDILEAFQYGDLPLLNRPDARAQLALRIQSGWFQLTAGGTSWRLTEPDDVHDAKGRQGPPVLGDAQTALLTRLNEAQRDLDQTARQLASAQWDVFALWWKHQRLEHYVSPPPEWSSWLDAVRAGTAEARGEALALVGTYRWLRQCRDTAFLELEAVRKHLTLSSIALPSFAQPNEPVLLMTGANRAYKHGEDDAFASDGTLFCRFTGQTVAGIEVDVESQRVIVGASAMKLPQLVGPDLPPEVHDLSVEAVFLDTTEAPAIAMAADPTNPWPLLHAIRRSQTIVWNPDVHPGLVRQTIADGSGLLSLFGLGAIPSKAAVQIWSPPWSPLYLSWEITYDRATQLTDDQLRCWKPPDDNRVEGVDDFTYSWRGTNPLKVVGPVTLSGKTLLTPQASDVLAARLEALIDEYADSEDVIEDLWALEDALAYVRHADLLSQSLSGLDLLLLERGQASFRTPFGTTDSVVLQPYLRPDGAPWLVPDSAPLPRVPPRQFSPIRAAHVAISRLWVVDDFGQVFDVLGAMHVTPPTFEPILGPDLATPGSPRYIELKPRLAQPSACELALLGAEDDDAAVGIETAVNPVCGWLVPNRLDASLLVYDKAGQTEGELLLAKDDVLWLPPPTTAPPPHDSGRPTVAVRNRHLRQIVCGVLDRPDGPSRAAGLRDFLQLIDESFWTIAPEGPWADEALPVLMGRPLAVLRARLGAMTAGAPAIRQSWEDSARRVTDGFEKVRFAVQLGSTELLDDGLVGYYLDDDYRQIQSVFARGPGPPGSYVGDERAVVSFELEGSTLLTLVADPQRVIHTITGLLPPTALTVPNEFVTPALERIAVTFRLGPLLNDRAAVAMPLPALQDGSWSWLQYEGTLDPAVEISVTDADGTAHLPDALPIAREGWLKLMLHAAPTELTYSIVPQAVRCTADATLPYSATFQVSAYNGSGLPVEVSKIQLEIPVGSAPSDLAEHPETIGASVLNDAGWIAESDKLGKVTARPKPEQGPLAAGATLVLLVDGVQVNREVGTAVITICEDAAGSPSTAVRISKIRPPAPRAAATQRPRGT